MERIQCEFQGQYIGEYPICVLGGGVQRSYQCVWWEGKQGDTNVCDWGDTGNGYYCWWMLCSSTFLSGGRIPQTLKARRFNSIWGRIRNNWPRITVFSSTILIYPKPVIIDGTPIKDTYELEPWLGWWHMWPLSGQACIGAPGSGRLLFFWVFFCFFFISIEIGVRIRYIADIVCSWWSADNRQKQYYWK